MQYAQNRINAVVQVPDAGTIDQLEALTGHWIEEGFNYRTQQVFGGGVQVLILHQTRADFIRLSVLIARCDRLGYRIGVHTPDKYYSTTWKDDSPSEFWETVARSQMWKGGE